MAITLALLVSTRPVDLDRVEAIGSRIKCPVCQGESIANSPSPMAEDMMDLVAERVAAGATDDQVIAELLTSYSGALLLDPPTSGNTLILWLAPLAAVVAGVVVIMWWKRHPGADTAPTGPRPTRSRTRLVVGGVILVAVFAGIVVVAGNSLQEGVASAAGVADIDRQDLSDVSNETMEAVIAANLDDPQIAGMRLALAERYFEVGDYRSAFPHYLAVAEDGSATSGQAVTALVRLGWMAYEGNGEVDTALNLVDEALAIEPESQVARYVRARIQWCGAGAADDAAAVFQSLLEDPALPDDTRAQIEADLETARSGGSCR
jgi:cytochrome c-type biogenesis protein CcmH/NrfF